MNSEVKKGVLLTLGALSLILLGAGGTWAFSKMTDNHLQSSFSPITTAHAAVNSAPKSINSLDSSNPLPESDGIQATKITDQSEVQATRIKPDIILARILQVRPHYVYKTVPYESCHMVPRTVVVSHGRNPSGLGAVLGGVAGGIAGNQIGQGRGNIAATIGGSVVGAIVGNEVERNADRPQARTIYTEVCETHYIKKAVKKGYEITYSYEGQKKTIIMKNPPKGNTLTLQAS